ncbi:MAG: ABC transporter ATP-binding protein [Euzebyales bacterium]|jgi:ABC-2 type transport system ATP-binding protein|nr:ABC transporter ATP-binding protein [Euzebyales bacterium]
MTLVPAVEVVDLTKRYGAVTAVDGLSFTVPEGACLAVLGPNGAGKTTTVECLEGFRRPDGGRVRILGRDPVADRDVVLPLLGVMLQGGGAYPAASPRELVRLYARYYREPLDPDRLLERVGLVGPPADARVRTLSGGERQRLSLALALVGRPQVACLDEPTAGMDPVARADTWRLLAELRARGATVLLTTHALDEAEALADEVAIVHRGRLRAIDRPERLAAGAGDRIEVTYEGDVDPDEVARLVGARVEAAGPGRLVLAADRAAIAPVAAWFAEHRVPLASIGPAGGGLEAAYLRLVADDVRPPLPHDRGDIPSTVEDG